MSNSTLPELDPANALGHSKLPGVKRHVPSGVGTEWKETEHLTYYS